MIWAFMGGIIEARPEGKAMLPDQVTGQPREVVWSNHLRVTQGTKVLKLNGTIVKEIAKLYKEDKEFRQFAEQCP